ncbi:MAG TPA: toll/interleukin-1 receptor domain-containing protein [Roseiarcus sp.]
MSWNVVLQLDTAPTRFCEQFSIPGLRRPCRICIICDPGLEATASLAFGELRAALATKAASSQTCRGPIHPGCQTKKEPACVHALVPVVDQPSAGVVAAIAGWMAGSQDRWLVLPAVARGVDPAKVLAALSTKMSRLQLVPWGGDLGRLASIVLRRAVYGERPRLFVSYRRKESQEMADQLFDTMSRRGFQLFLDRFSGTPGRLFPQEIAEELAERDVVILIETPKILQSRWTKWEVAFARRYRLGLLALQWPGAPTFPGVANRLMVTPQANGELTQADLASAANFIEREHTFASLTRPAFYEALINQAAKTKSGWTEPLAEGAWAVRDANGTRVAAVAPAGRPGRLGDARLLALAPVVAPNGPLILAGQHRHLPLGAQTDMTWLATKLNIELLGHVDAYARVKALV